MKEIVKSLLAFISTIAIIAIVIMPISAQTLDMLLIASLSIGFTLLFMSNFYNKHNKYLTTIPLIVVFGTLFRTALAVSATREILMIGNNAPESVSSIVNSLGGLMLSVGYIQGAILFTLLLVVNFIIVSNITKRLSNYATNYALDVLPGKLMAIDGQISQGKINQSKAQSIKDKAYKTAEFYGSLDGSSKFIKGDTIALILIILTNLFGGLLIGVFQYGMPIDIAISTYLLLTIGAGLIFQISNLLFILSLVILMPQTHGNQFKKMLKIN